MTDAPSSPPRSPRRFLGSVRFYILAACVVALLPLLWLGIREYSQRKVLDENLTRERLEQQLVFIREAYESRVKGPLRGELVHLIDSPIIDALLLASADERALDAKDLERLFQRVSGYSDQIGSISFVNRVGVEEAAVEGGKRTITYRDFRDATAAGEDADHQQVRAVARTILDQLRAKADHLLIVEGPYRDAGGHSYVVAAISRADPDIGAFGGAIMMLYRIDPFIAEMKALEFRGVPVVWLLSAQGEPFLAPPADRARLDPRPVLASGAGHTLVLRDEGALVAADLAVDDVAKELTAAVSVPSSVYRRSVLESRDRFLVWAVVSIMLSILAAVVLSNTFISRPIKQLSLATKEVASGNVSRDVRLTTASWTQPVEIRELAAHFTTLLERLRQIPRTLEASTAMLTEAVAHLEESSKEQVETINRQAAALHEAQVTVQEIRQTSLVASQKAESVLNVVARADEIGRTGEVAIDDSLGAFTGIRVQVGEIAERINRLNERTRQIGFITETVKDLADQSNMLALNAAIEAVRSGEHGKGFSVVAREIRSLADQSIQATNRVREILTDIGKAIETAVSITETGSRSIEEGASQMTVSGGKLRELSSIVKDNAAAVRQIAATVSQQNAGITQILTAVNDLNSMMAVTVKRLDLTMESIKRLSEVADQVTQVVKSFRVE